MEVEDIHICTTIRNEHYCESTFVMHDSNHHTCESAIYYNMATDIIKDLCQFQFSIEKQPQPAILDTGTSMLVANIPTPWKYDCTHDRRPPQSGTKDSYFMVAKSSLCLCSIIADPYVISQSITNCDSYQTTTGQLRVQNLSLTYMVNQAAMLYYPALAENLDLTKDVLLKTPLDIQFKIPSIMETPNENVLHHVDIGAAKLQDIMPLIKKQRDIWKSQADKARIGRMKLKFDSHHSWRWIAMVLGITAAVIVVVGLVVCLLCYKFGPLRKLKYVPVPHKSNQVAKKQRQLWRKILKLRPMGTATPSQSRSRSRVDDLDDDFDQEYPEFPMTEMDPMRRSHDTIRTCPPTPMAPAEQLPATLPSTPQAGPSEV